MLMLMLIAARRAIFAARFAADMPLYYFRALMLSMPMLMLLFSPADAGAALFIT